MPNIEYTPAQMADAIKALNVPLMEQKEITIIDNGTTIITPSSGYDGISELDVITNIEQGIAVHPTCFLSDITSAEWTRPQNWPDLDTIELPSDFDGIYMTYDLSKTKDYGWIGLYVEVQNQTDWIIERGHLSNNIFIADETYTVAHANYFRQTLLDANGEVQLWRLTASDHIRKYGFVTNSDVTANALDKQLQPCVEIIGNLPYVTSFSSTSTLVLATYWTERYNIKGISSSVTNMTSMFSGCYSLKVLNTSDWDTSGVTSMQNMFQNCYSLKILNVSNWDTSNVAYIQNMFQNCYNLQSLNTSNWNTSKITSMLQMFQNCYNLELLDVSKWDITKVTSMQSMFYSCHNLVSLDVSNWDTSAVKNMSNMFSLCCNLRLLDVSNWDISNVTTLSSMFSGCYSLKFLDVSNWNTSKVTSMQSMFSNCMSLRILDVSNWDVSGLTLSNALNSTFSYCRSLRVLDLSKWKLTHPVSLSSIVESAMSLRELDLSNIDSQFVTSYQNYGSTTISIVKLNAGNQDASHITNQNQTPGIGGSAMLIDYENPFIFPLNQNCNAKLLTRASLLAVLNNLPTLTTTRTLTLGENRKKLTPEEIAIATQKGWTVA